MRTLALAFLVISAVGVIEVQAKGSSTSLHIDDKRWKAFEELVAASKKSMMADPGAALLEARKAAALAQGASSSSRQREAIATSLWLEGEALNRTNQPGAARMTIWHASKLAAGDGEVDKLDGDLALSRARIADNGGDVALALKSYQEAHRIFFKLGEPRSQAIALQGLGLIYDKAHDFAHEIKYYTEAAQVYQADPVLALSAANNIGFALQQMGQYDKAVDGYKKALKIATELKSTYLEVEILTNLAAVYTKQNKLNEAEHSADRALLLIGAKDENGQAPFAWGVKANIEYRRHGIQTAVSDLAKAFHGIDLATTVAPFRDFHEIAYKIYEAAGNFELALAHHKAFKRLDDEGRSLAASTNLALSSAQFDFARQQLEIVQLKAAKLQRDIALRKSRAAAQRLIFVAILIAGLGLLGWIGWRNIVARKHRDAIARKNVQLKKVLRERNLEIERRVDTEVELRRAVEAAQQASRSKSQFLANMSHELRTPLNAIIGFSEVITAGNLKPEKSKEYASDIATGGRQLLAVLNDILDMARIGAGNVMLDISDVRLGDLVDYAAEVAGNDERMGNRQIKATGGHRYVVVRADEVRLRRVLRNLISNAVKFTRDDGLIEVEIERETDGVDLVVRDNGAGVPPEMMEKIMEPFGQAEGAYARSHGGVGLGLPIVKSLVEMHGGSFKVTSKVGSGTEARVHFPTVMILQEQDKLAAAQSHSFERTAA